MSSLVVHLNGRDLYDVDAAADVHETGGSFDVELRNHGQPVHVHLRLDEALSRVCAVDGQNHYVEEGSALRVPVTVADDAPQAEGALTVVTGYGKGTGEVTVSVVESTDGPDVEVDETLDRPEVTVDDGGSGVSPTARLPVDASRLPDLDPRVAVGLVALVVVAVGAAAVAAVAAPGFAVVVGIFAVLVGIGVAGYLLVA